MTINTDLIGRIYGPYETQYDLNDLLAFGVGSGAAQDGKTDLDWAFEKDLKVNPVFLATIDASDKVTEDINFGFNWDGVLHWGIDMKFHHPFVKKVGKLTTNITLTGLYDRGEGRGCLAQKTGETFDEDGNKLLTIENWDICLYDGGFGGPKAPQDIVDMPDRAPDFEFDDHLNLNSALVFRLIGIYHHLHADWEYANEFGYEKPFYMGLGLAGIAFRHITNQFLGRRPERMKRFKLRFTGVSYPGMDVRTQVWEMPDQSVRFRVVDANNPETILLNFALAEWQ